MKVRKTGTGLEYLTNGGVPERKDGIGWNT
jgi:hypothetical protein